MSSGDTVSRKDTEDREAAENREDEFLAEMAGLWGSYLYAVLVQEKYNLKHGENRKHKEDSDEED